MIETIVLNYMNSSLSVPAFMEMPDDDIDSFVIIEKTGESEENFVESATIAIQSYASSLAKAAILNEEVKAAMRNIIELNTISKSKLNSSYNFTDATKKQYRYQSVFDLVAF